MDRLEDLYHKSYRSNITEDVTSEEETGSDSGTEGIVWRAKEVRNVRCKKRVERIVPPSPTESESSDDGLDFEDANLFDSNFFSFDDRGIGEAQEWLDVLSFFCGPVSITVSEDMVLLPQNISSTIY